MGPSSTRHARLLGPAVLGLTLIAVASFAAAATPAPAATAAPTWGALYARYMAKGTVGDCASCHARAATAALAYDWLAQQQYMLGSPPYLIDPKSSCFSWQGGDMPPDGPSSYARASREFAAWAAGGAARE